MTYSDTVSLDIQVGFEQNYYKAPFLGIYGWDVDLNLTTEPDNYSVKSQSLFQSNKIIWFQPTMPPFHPMPHQWGPIIKF